LCAVLFLYRNVLQREVGELTGLVRAKRRRKLPVVLTPEEVKRVLSCLTGVERLFLSLLYGTGMRLLEGLRLRVKDVDLIIDQITVRDGKGEKDRITMLPATLKTELVEHLKGMKRLHEGDLGAGYGKVQLPYALARKYPRAAGEWGWQFVFPAPQQSRDPRTGEVRRHHLHERPVLERL
jgi:integrase